MGNVIADVRPGEPAVMADGLESFNNGLQNAATGLGTIKDKGALGAWFFAEPDYKQLEAAYRSNWIARKVVDVPAMDAMREGWEWQAEKNEIAALEAEARRLSLVPKLIQAIQWARLYGGAAIYISDGSEDVTEPLNVKAIQKGGVSFLKVFSRYQLGSREIETDPRSEYEGLPKLYTMKGSASGSVKVHPTRLIRFVGKEIPSATGVRNDPWGDSVLTAVEQTIRDCTAGQQGIATLIQEASVDVWKIKDFMTKISDPKQEAAFLKRMSLMQQTKSLVNGVVIDADDDWSQKTASFGSLPDVQRLLLQIASGAADIPATRLLGQAPQGMNATGESDLINYYDRISADQNVTLRPCLDRLFDALVPSALGRPNNIEYVFNPLWQMSAKEKSEVDKRNAETAEIYDRAALVDQGALREGVKAQLIQNDVYPGISDAIEATEVNGPAPDAGDGEGDVRQ